MMMSVNIHADYVIHARLTIAFNPLNYFNKYWLERFIPSLYCHHERFNLSIPSFELHHRWEFSFQNRLSWEKIANYRDRSTGKTCFVRVNFESLSKNHMTFNEFWAASNSKRRSCINNLFSNCNSRTRSIPFTVHYSSHELLSD